VPPLKKFPIRIKQRQKNLIESLRNNYRFLEKLLEKGTELCAYNVTLSEHSDDIKATETKLSNRI
jgi:hypothetical protein